MSTAIPNVRRAKRTKRRSQEPSLKHHRSKSRVQNSVLSMGKLETIRWWILYLFVLVPVRVIFSILLPPILTYVWHNGSFLHLAQDDEPVYAKVRVVGRNIPYGPHWRETVDEIIPDPARVNLGRDGLSWFDFVVAIAKTAFDLITCHLRAILALVFPRIFGFDNRSHRLASKFHAVLFVHGDPHPQQLLSGLRMLKWLKEQHYHETVSLVGESAGGNLVTMLAALVSNPPALAQFSFLVNKIHKLTEEDVCEWDYPKVQSVVSWYGILDLESWRSQGILSWGLEWTVDAHRCYAPYPFLKPSGNLSQRCDFLAITEACERGWVDYYPPVLLIAAATDPLGLLHSSRRARIALKSGVRYLNTVEYAEYEAGHAFIGLNPFILAMLHGEKWRTHLALPAVKRSIDFIKLHANT